MSDLEPEHPRGASVGGRVIEILGWLICAVAIGVLVLEIVMANVTVPGVVLVVLVAIAGGATVATGRAVERSRDRGAH